MLTLSIVVPIYSGEQYIESLFSEVAELRTQWQQQNAPILLGELIFVNDDAIDNSAEVLQQLADTHEWVTVLHHSRNFGQHPATVTGILNSSGDFIVTMDEDLQHRPRHIPELLDKLVSSCCDVVYAKPTRFCSQWSISRQLFKVGQIPAGKNDQ